VKAVDIRRKRSVDSAVAGVIASRRRSGVGSLCSQVCSNGNFYTAYRVVCSRPLFSRCSAWPLNLIFLFHALQFTLHNVFPDQNISDRLLTNTRILNKLFARFYVLFALRDNILRKSFPPACSNHWRRGLNHVMLCAVFSVDKLLFLQAIGKLA
jgi:hypothetical protein